MNARTLLALLLPFSVGCTVVDLWDTPDVTVEELSCRYDTECAAVRFEVRDELRNDPCLVAERSCDRVNRRCIVELRARDSDRDNFRDLACADVRLDFPPFDVDCDDGDPLAYPNADRDGDGFVVVGCADGMPEDCDDSRATAYPGATVEACDGVVSTCVDTTPPLRRTVEDFDGDRFAAVDLDPSVCVDVTAEDGTLLTIPHTDCDDTDELVFPEAPDVCDGRHNDCSAPIGVGPDPGEDVDGDGFASPSSLSCDPNLPGGLPNTDCDDLDPKTYPSAPESCDLIVNDCTKRTNGSERLVEDPDRDGKFAANADCIDPVVDVECISAAYDRFSTYCMPSNESTLASSLTSVSVLRAGDLNGDLADEVLYVRDDLASPCATSDQLTLRYAVTNVASTSLQQIATICDSASTSTVDAVFVDADGDAALEIVTLSNLGTMQAYDASVSSSTLTLVAKVAQVGVSVTSRAFAIGRLPGESTPSIVAREGDAIGIRPLNSNSVAGAVTVLDPAAADVTGIVIADATGDGIVDLITHSATSSTVRIRPGIATGGFASPLSLDVNALLPGIGSVIEVHVGDVEGDADGDPDLVVVGPTGLGILALRGGSHVGVPVGISPNGEALGVGDLDPIDVSLRDLDSDGRTEILFAISERDSVGYVDEIGTNLFAQHVFVADLEDVSAVAGGDFDGDGDVDFVAHSPAFAQLSRFTSYFVSVFQPGGRYVDRAFDTDLVVATDFDADGIVDFAAAPADAGSDVIVWRGRTRDFGASDELVAFRADGGVVYTGLAAGDVSGDTRSDLVVTTEASGRVQLARGNGDVTFAALESLPTFDHANAALVADLEAGGASELLVAANGGVEGRVAAYGRAGVTGSFTRTVLATGTAPCVELAAGDVDDDGDLDVAVACRTGGLFVLRNPGTLAGTWTTIDLVAGAGGADVSSVDVVDLDRDGNEDVVAYRADLDAVVVFVGSGSGVSTTAIVVPIDVVSNTGAIVRAHDFDRDGDADLVVAGLENGSTVRQLQSVGGDRIRFVSQLLRPSNATTRTSAVVIHDIDKDADDDILMSIRGDRDVISYRSSASTWWSR